jgi:hypothetical protein
MPTYRITDPQSGIALKITGDEFPSKDQLEWMFARARATKPPSSRSQEGPPDRVSAAGAQEMRPATIWERTMPGSVSLGAGGALSRFSGGASVGDTAKKSIQAALLASIPATMGAAGPIVASAGRVVSNPFMLGGLTGVSDLARGKGVGEATVDAVEAGLLAKGLGAAGGVLGAVGGRVGRMARLWNRVRPVAQEAAPGIAKVLNRIRPAAQEAVPAAEEAAAAMRAGTQEAAAAARAGEAGGGSVTWRPGQRIPPVEPVPLPRAQGTGAATGAAPEAAAAPIPRSHVEGPVGAPASAGGATASQAPATSRAEASAQLQELLQPGARQQAIQAGQPGADKMLQFVEEGYRGGLSAGQLVESLKDRRLMAAVGLPPGFTGAQAREVVNTIFLKNGWPITRSVQTAAARAAAGAR